MIPPPTALILETKIWPEEPVKSAVFVFAIVRAKHKPINQT
jgi:hypothetical protein